MTGAELGLCLWIGEGIPFDGAQPAFSYGARARYRPASGVAAELAGTVGPLGTDLVVDGLGFLGEPSDDVVLAPIVGLGVRSASDMAPLLQAGFAMDLVLAEIVDLRVDTRLNWTPADRLGLMLSVGPQLHTTRGFDKDSDGISDRLDRCDTAKEDFDGYLDADGCPELDNDQDGALDTADACPAIAEDRDGFLDTDGCPEPDNDGDGLIDDRDACINAPEDADGNTDLDGCPDPDNDGDLVLDVADACPNVGEDRDAFEDADGCPEPDNDGDGVGDAFDAAPNDPENINFFEDDDGEPEALPPLLLKVLGTQPKLRFAGHKLTDSGRDRAELIATALVQWPALRVKILVTDNDLERAGKRAISVAAALVELGVVAERIDPEGTSPGENEAEGVLISLTP